MPAALFLLCALSARNSARATLFEVPARFVSGCPIVSLDLASELKGRQPLEFILDSGATRSVLLNPAEARDRTFDSGWRGLLIPGQTTLYVGNQDFAAPNLAQFNHRLIDRLLGLKVQGILGADFMTTHEILIDYGSRRVFLSRSRQAKRGEAAATRWTLVGSKAGDPASRVSEVLNQLRLLDAAQAAYVPLTLDGPRAYVTARLAEKAGRPWKMRLDTWATRSTLKPDVASGLRRTGVSERVTTARSTLSADQVEAMVSIASDVSLSLRPVATNATESVLGSDAFQGNTVLLQLGSARFRLWPESVMAAFAG